MADLVNINNTATEIVAALDEYGDFSVGMTATEFVGEVNDALDANAAVTDTATELVGKINEAADAEPVAAPEPIKFLHYSDPHGGTANVTKSVKMMSDADDADYDADIDFAILTGDNADAYYAAMATALVNADTVTHRHLVMMGNHDIGNTAADATSYKRDHAAMVAALHDYMAEAGVSFGGEGCAYWHKDFQLTNGKKLRLIATDEYDINANDAGFGYASVFTQAQINWFINLLDTLNPGDFFIVATHKYPVRYSSVTGGIKQYRARNKFTSSWLYAWDGSDINMGVFADIVHAYTHKTSIVGTYSTSGYTGGSSVTVNKDWSSLSSPATFICHLCGHLHGDFCGPHPIHTDQLVLDIDTSKTSVSVYTYAYEADQSDIQTATRTTAGGVILNKVTIDFEHHRLTIDRIGAKQTTARTVDSSTYPNDAGDTQGKEYPAVTRDTITFDFTTAQVVEEGGEQ